MLNFLQKEPFTQSTPEDWRKRWQSLVEPQYRDVPVTLNGETVVAFVQKNQFVMMLQDGLLMEASFFDVCDFFRKCGYHVIWLMRCTQDIANGYLRLKKTLDGGESCVWNWRSPTTNFGRWTSDNYNATILIQYQQLPDGELQSSDEHILQRVTWAQSDDAAKMIPGRTEFTTVDTPASAKELLRWLNGITLAKLRE